MLISNNYPILRSSWHCFVLCQLHKTELMHVHVYDCAVAKAPESFSIEESPFLHLQAGTYSADEMLDAMRARQTLSRWGYRMLGWLLMYAIATNRSTRCVHAELWSSACTENVCCGCRWLGLQLFAGPLTTPATQSSARAMCGPVVGEYSLRLDGA